MIQLFNGDCLEAMKKMKDDEFDLAIVDPPYGIGKKMISGEERSSKFTNKKDCYWDNSTPSKEYFSELFRISKNQIIWGANYFLDKINISSRCVLIWDKCQQFSGSDFEMAWSSFDSPAKAFRMSRVEAYSKGKIHICQKPVALYTWLLDKYAKPGDKILDTHLGSGSIAIACHNLGYDLVGYELDKDYFEAAKHRLEEHQKQLRLF
jgi:site-specific DNA-methyltransferase (adenine-specific)